MEVSRQNRGGLFLDATGAQFRIVGKAPFTRTRPICLDSGGTKTCGGRFVMSQKRENNNNWKGGKSITAHGYVLIRVGTDHHLADVRGYAYEHRLVAEQMLGRPLQPNEIIHHKDRDAMNNSPENLQVVIGNAGHYIHHRTRNDLRSPGEPNPLVSCACGCGATFYRYDSSNRPRRFISGHNMKRRSDNE